MQSVIFNYVNTGAYVKQEILIAVRNSLSKSTQETWHIKNANTIGPDQFAHPVGLKKSICGSHTCVDQALNNGYVSILRILKL